MYIDDLPVTEGTAFIKIFDANIAHAKIKSIDFTEAELSKGVLKIFSYRDIPSQNQIGGIIPDEPLLAEHELHFWGQPILLIAAESEDEAEEALQKIKIEFEAITCNYKSTRSFQTK